LSHAAFYYGMHPTANRAAFICQPGCCAVECAAADLLKRGGVILGSLGTSDSEYAEAEDWCGARLDKILSARFMRALGAYALGTVRGEI